ncbi:MAG: MG2 domain-containing protein, partial [Bryobacteraceae bacterium]
MKFHSLFTKPAYGPAVILCSTLIGGCIALLLIGSHETEASGGKTLVATHKLGSLNVTIPYEDRRAGSGQLVLEVLDPEDGVLGRSERAATITTGRGQWQETLRLAKPLPLDDLVWHRLHYRFVFTDKGAPAIEGIEPLSTMLRIPVIHVLAQQTYASGAQAAVRIIAMDSANQPIGGAGAVRVEFGEKHQLLYTGSLNSRGTAEAQFRFPVGVAGNQSLRYVVDTPLGSTELTQPVQLENKTSILLTTEKPLYQPSQTIHVRALALDRVTHEAAANRKLTFEIEDSRGNKVFKTVTQTDAFGVASSEFPLADEVNLGTYHLRAQMDEEGSGNTSELALNVEKYVLPKFKVAVEFTLRNQHGYRPGDHVAGVVRANYFFGKAVEGEVMVKATGLDVTQFEAASVEGHTDADGAYHFDLKLPAYFVGKPLNGSAARVLLEAVVKDSAAHSETRGEPITISESPLIVTAVPEGGTVAPGLENQIFVLTSYADGKPAITQLRVHADGNSDQTASTDEGGIASIHLKPGFGPITIDAKDKEGNRVQSTVALNLRTGADQILLRGEKAIYRAGDRMRFTVLSTRNRATAYVDVIKDSQTILTRDVDIVNGQAEFELPATPALAGTLDVNAYLFGANAIPVADHRLVFVQPADELRIETTSDAPVYKPGTEARVRFRVTNTHGQGVQAALGLQVVDEAVFALAEKQPGFAKVFFYLEQDVMKPRYEIHSTGISDLITEANPATASRRDRAAQALFSATELVNRNRFQAEAGRGVLQAKFVEYSQRYQVKFREQAQEVAERLTRDRKEHPGTSDLIEVMAKDGATPIRDAWGTPLRVQHARWQPDSQYSVRSAGADKTFDTGDDMEAFLQTRNTRVVVPSGSGRFDVEIEHDRGPFNGRAEIAGTVRDVTGVALVGAAVTAHEISTGVVRRTRSDAAGEFTLASLSPGKYRVVADSPGFTITSGLLNLKQRDRAVLSATLEVGSVSQTVEVVAAAPVMLLGARNQRNAGFMADVVGRFAERMPMQAPISPAVAAKFVLAEAVTVANEPVSRAQEDAGQEARVRSYFPESLFINPEIITDQRGEASIVIPMADSITTWRMAMVASTQKGALGAGTSSLKVFQDFFVDLDLPVTLTQGDRVSIPVAAYNYSGTHGQVSLDLRPADWFTLVNDSSNKTVSLESGRVGGSQFTIEAKRIGKFKLTLAAKMPGRADIVIRDIEVIPNGREQTEVFNGRLESSVQHDVLFPADAIQDASTVFVRLYPGPLSQVVEGMDAILRMPYGCFEQTSSSTYPNVLALDYMKRSKKITPEVHAKAEGFITNGYQRLLTFEVPGGGFSWFGNAPANKILTSYGLMEFSDMSKVHDVDPKLIQRTQQWLASQQKADGSWPSDRNFINEGATDRYNFNALRITAYIAWALANTKYQGPAVDRAKQYLENYQGAKTDPYTLAVIANFATAYEKDQGFTSRAVEKLLEARTERDDKAWWTTEETSVYGMGESATIETTGLAAQALLSSGRATATVRKALAYLASKKDASGT